MYVYVLTYNTFISDLTYNKQQQHDPGITEDNKEVTVTNTSCTR